MLAAGVPLVVVTSQPSASVATTLKYLYAVVGYGEGAIDFPDFELAGAGHCTLAGEGAIDFPEFKLSGSGYVGDLHDDTILEHQRDERFIT